MFQPDGHLDAEILSAWLDAPEDFTEQDRLAVETHLRGCAMCRQTAAELTAIVRAFQALPLADPSRSFALTREMAGLVATPTLPASRPMEEPAHPHERTLAREPRKLVTTYERAPWYERQMSTLRWATAVAALLFVFFVGIDVLGNAGGGGDDDDAAAPAMVQASLPTEASGAAETGAEPAATSGAGSSELAPATEAAGEASTAAEDTARQFEPTATTAASGGASGAEPTPAGASGGEATAQTGSTAPEPTPASGEPAATSADTETMTMMAPTEPEQADQAQQATETTSAYSGNNTFEENQESNALHLIELGLAILIGWLIVAMIALPRLRRHEP